MSHVEEALPVEKPLFTPGVFALLGLIAIGLGFAVYRYIYGLGAMTNLNDQYPWGIWIGVDVASGVALAAGGFTTSALAHIFHREHYHAIVRPALLTAMLGYTFVGLSLMVDLGRYYNIWHPVLPSMWQGNSALFEVAMCVMAYLTVLYLEFVPILMEGLKGKLNLPAPLDRVRGPVESLLKQGWFQQIVELADRFFGKIMFLLVIAGVVLSCMHQSSLGALMAIAPYKVHPLWYTPVLTLLFLMSAIAVGYPMVIFESMWASRAFGRKPEMEVLTPLARVIPFLLGAYIVAKVSDLVVRGAYVYLFDGSFQSLMFFVEFGLGVVLPFFLLLSDRVRRSPTGLFISATLYVVLGVLLNRINVFVIAYRPPYATEPYVPSIGEVAITVAMISALVLCYRLIVSILPVLPAPEGEEAPHAAGG
jgi:Ni/Fe-hydrogenase subunit HybB-like protein